MKRRYGILAAAGLLAAALLTAGCGGKDFAGNMAVSEDGIAVGNGTTSDAAASQESLTEEAAAETSAGSEQIASSSGIDSVEITGQKLIKTVNLAMQTRDFDGLLESVQKKTEECGGYVENSDISGLSYYNTNGYRYAWLTLRIPSERLDEFVTVVSGLGNVTSKNESVQDVTLQYVDVESHIQALETEQTRLLELMEQAESMEDIIQIESRLSEIRYELQSYESRLRTYDNQINYSTVYVNIDEVDRETAVEENPGFFGEIRIRLSDSFYHIGQGIRGFAVWFFGSLPYLIIVAAVLWIIVRVFQKIAWNKPFFRRKKGKDAEKISAAQGQETGKKVSEKREEEGR